MVEGPFRIPARIYREDHQLRDTKHWLKRTFISMTAEGEPRLARRDVTPGPYPPTEREH
jgi:succinate dehydrogenase/fumarate reductase flavoprotein subunit